eukprot:TRINITY_DN9267_c0_g5_i1.p1 TRINITY_DN9267_c0_g5~~TRINITY_DN9267_c0_g5_i1.p1  ORF type:complete len:443 (-),score=75.59 TRINITY_DN9267_c0_g5_i1:27-1355(-)
MLAMFGGTVLVPMLAGFHPNTSLFFSGIGTIVFFIVTGGNVPSYLGSSFAFLGVIAASTGYVPGSGRSNPRIDVALGGIITAGAAYATVAVIVMVVGYHWIEYLLPPVVTGAIIMAIGLNLSVTAINDASRTSDSPWQAVFTALVVSTVSIWIPGVLGRLPVLIGLSSGFLLSLVVGLLTGDPTRRIDFTAFNNASWFDVPPFVTPVFDSKAISIITPVFIIQVAENLGHVKAISAITGSNLLPYLGVAFLGDSIATILSGCGGGLGLTTYAENIGVMAVTKIYSTLIFLVAAFFSILLGFVPKFGGLILCVPSGVYGGLSIVLFGLVASTGARIWILNGVDFSDPVNLITSSVALVLGAGMIEGRTVRLGSYVQLDGLGTATIACIFVHFVYRRLPELWKKYKTCRSTEESEEVGELVELPLISSSYGSFNETSTVAESKK